jgi:predicted TIM-barrel fold metal-dependent hydrolase
LTFAIVDAHCHAGSGDGFTGPWDTAAPLKKYLIRAAEARISKTIVLPVFDSDYHRANVRLARLVRLSKGRLIGFAMMHAERDRDRTIAMINFAVRNLGFKGIKLHRHDARISRPVCEAAKKWRLPVLYDVVGEVPPVELLATEYPDVAFVIPHLGSFSDDWGAQRTLIDQLVRHPNVFTDTSGVRRYDLLEEAVARAGAHKIIFGSDGPFLHPALELQKIRLLRLAPSDLSKITGGNILRLLSRIRVR